MKGQMEVSEHAGPNNGHNIQDDHNSEGAALNPHQAAIKAVAEKYNLPPTTVTQACYAAKNSNSPFTSLVTAKGMTYEQTVAISDAVKAELGTNGGDAQGTNNSQSTSDLANFDRFESAGGMWGV